MDAFSLKKWPFGQHLRFIDCSVYVMNNKNVTLTKINSVWIRTRHDLMKRNYFLFLYYIVMFS